MNSPLAGLVVAIVILGAALVRVENQRYALYIGMCGPNAGAQMPDPTCLSRIKTRTGWWWHLFYAVKDTF